ncbi:MAG: response regulator transcription factor [Deltaproteobacteria bacterium]|nr:response regulator transcription factor [Deltaproteobacteria bacterium]
MQKAKLLLMDDDTVLVDALSLAFEDAGYAICTAFRGDQGLEVFTREKPDLVISDVNMPGLDGFSFCRELRKRGLYTPLILLTAREDEIDEALGFEFGADDYVIKPARSRALLARVERLLARTKGQSTIEPLRSGPLSLDLESMEAKVHDVTLRLTVTEFRLIEVMATRPGMVFSRTTLLDRTHTDGTQVAERLVDTYVKRLRQKMKAVENTFDPIETVIGAGYRWRRA